MSFRDHHSPAELAHWLGLPALPPTEWAQRPVLHYAFDTRLLPPPPDSLFVALQGPTRDGHQFVGRAYAAGVRRFLVQQGYVPEADTLPDAVFLRVPNPLRALQAVAAAHRGQFAGPVVGIAGSKGKTIVKEWLATLLAPDFEVYKSPRSYNSQLGVALALLGLRGWHTLALVECGISEPGEMQRLARMVRPTHGILTHFSDAHDDNFACRAQKLHEMLLLFEGCQAVLATEQLPELAGMLAVALGNATGAKGPSALPTHATTPRLDRAGASEAATFRCQPCPGPGGAFRLLGATYAPPAPDAASTENLMLAVAFCLYMGLRANLAAERTSMLAPVSMRTELITDNPEISILNDAYNADEASVRNAFALLEGQHSQPGRRVVLTDLEHLGPRAPEVQARLLDEAAQRFGARNVWAVGPVFETLKHQVPGLRVFADIDALLQSFDYEHFAHSTVLLKGTRRFRLERLVPHLSLQASSTVLRVDLDALKHNLAVYRTALPPRTHFMCMLKASAYGSGAWQLAQEMAREGVEWFGVAYTAEGIALRRKGVRARLMVMNPDVETLEQLPRHTLEPAVWSFELLEALAKPGRPLRVHLEFDTGMARLGFRPEECAQVLAHLAKRPHLEVASVFTHLAAAEDPAHDAFTAKQLQAFDAIACQVQALHPEALRHSLNSSGALRFPQHAGSLVRLGIGLFGLAAVPPGLPPLLEAVSLATSISQVRWHPAGTPIGYGLSTVLRRRSRIATLPVGYADGIPRSLSNGRGAVLVGGSLCPIVGRVCMDMLMADTTDVPTEVQPGHEAALFGQQGEACLSLNDVASRAGTIPYEVLAGIGARVRRVYGRD